MTIASATWPRWWTAAALAAIGTAVALRMAPLFTDFAFGDGGLFWVVANDLRGNGFLRRRSRPAARMQS